MILIADGKVIEPYLRAERITLGEIVAEAGKSRIGSA
ncbi:MAG: hypothetical protein QOE44_355 [Solirubrobacteraceae bacterium]|nr:hypothetical protein [Solirubrobacteraceae bacterium]